MDDIRALGSTLGSTLTSLWLHLGSTCGSGLVSTLALLSDLGDALGSTLTSLWLHFRLYLWLWFRLYFGSTFFWA